MRNPNETNKQTNYFYSVFIALFLNSQISQLSSRSASSSSSSSSSRLVSRYGELYSQLRLETLDALDRIPELVNSEELKNKLLFSVVVVSKNNVKLKLPPILLLSQLILQLEIKLPLEKFIGEIPG